MRLLKILFLFSLFNACTNHSCSYNEQANKNWINSFKINKLGISIKDSLKWRQSDNYKTPVTTYNIYDTIDKTNSIISVQEETYSDPCQAKKKFENELKYFQSDEPKFEKNDGPHFGLLQGVHYYSVKSNVGLDILAYKVFGELKKSLLLNSPDKNSSFIQYTYKKAVIE